MLLFFVPADANCQISVTRSGSDPNCGPISLSLAARMIGERTSFRDVLPRVKMETDGTTMETLGLAAREMGLASTAYELSDPAALLELAPRKPLIVSIRGNHFGVVWRAEDGTLRLADYPKETVQITPEALWIQIHPRVLGISRPGDAEVFTPPRGLHRSAIRAAGIGAAILLAGGILLLLLGRKFGRAKA